MNKIGEIKEKEFSLDHVFSFPEDITEHKIDGKYLLISAARANWLVLNNDEYMTFCLLREGKSIKETLFNMKIRIGKKVENVLQKVIIQIEEKQFYKKIFVANQKTLESATIYLTKGCNLRCSHCYMKATVVSSDECKYSHWKNFLNQFKKIGGKVVTITGGEPLIYKFLLDIVIYAKAIGLKIVLLTNGTLISNKNVEILGKNCSEIQVSIDGPDENTHDKIRGAGNYKKSMDALNQLSLFSSRLAIAMTPLPETLSIFKRKLPNFIARIRKNISKEVYFRISPQLLEGRNIGCLDNNQQELFHQEVYKICSNCLEKDYFDKLDAAALVPNIRIPGCGYAESLSVLWNGDIKACAFDNSIRGNIKNQTLSKIAKDLKKLSEFVNVSRAKPCCNCDIRYLCGGKCRLENIKMNGDINKPSCDLRFRDSFYRRLVRINKYIYEPLLAGRR